MELYINNLVKLIKELRTDLLEANTIKQIKNTQFYSFGKNLNK